MKRPPFALFACLYCAVCSVTVRAQSSAEPSLPARLRATVPVGDAAYAALGELFATPLLPRSGGAVAPPKAGLTRGEFVVVLVRTLQQIDRTPDDTLARTLTVHPAALPALTRLHAAFAADLRAAGIHADASASSLARLRRLAAPPFRDVPADHGASRSVERLRRAGIVVGDEG